MLWDKACKWPFWLEHEAAKFHNGWNFIIIIIITIIIIIIIIIITIWFTEKKLTCSGDLLK